MRPQQAVAPAETSTGHDGIVHFYCCNAARAWCGKDLSTEPDCPEGCGCAPCVVCADLLLHEDYDCCDGSGGAL